MSGSADAAVLGATDNHLLLPAGLDDATTYDVLLNDGHVWSLQPGRDGRQRDGRTVARWPKALRHHLVGRAEVVLRDHVSGERLGSTEHVFADAPDQTVSVTDRSGHALVLDKWGRLIRPLSAEDSGLIDELMDEVAEILDVLRDKAGVPAFICYGTLLGAVRDGRLIGHDNDIDLAYVSRHPMPVDVVREAYRVERTLIEEGWLVRRGSGTRINVRVTLSDGSVRFIDVFTAHWVEGVLYIPSDTGFRLPESVVLPLSTVTLMGRDLPAPADPERLLAETYGPSWRVPDPSFKYETPRWMARRLGGWFGGLKTGRKHWDAFYGSSRRKVPTEPTPFAQWVQEHHGSTRPLVDLGSGTGRDTLWFAEQGRQVVGVDYCIGITRRAEKKATSQDLPATFEVLNLYDARAVLALGARLSRRDEPVDLYARFLLHSLDYVGRRNVLRLASMSLRRGGTLFLEFRTPADRRRFHVFGESNRRYLRPAVVVQQIEAAGGTVVHREEGLGRAPLGDEDAHVCRIVARWT